MSLGANIRALRQLHGKTLEQVATATGTAVSNVHRYEKGDTPPAAWLEKFQDAFFIEPGALLRLGELVKQ
jgi:transcriptional regulator with XRE-family HTH domain